MGNSDFTELEVWKKARVFRVKVEEIAASFGKEEKYRLNDQIIRSSRSITANIAEGHGRFHYQENIQFCRIARGSLSETKDHLITALDNHLIQQEKYDELMVLYTETLKLLNGYINFLKKMKTK